jgi:hypothetical protein
MHSVRSGVRTLGILLAVLLGVIAFASAPYVLATLEDRRCFSGDSLGRATVESCLFLYTVSECDDEAHGHRLGEVVAQCVSYNILGVEPIYVIYDRDSHVQGSISAYE